METLLIKTKTIKMKKYINAVLSLATVGMLLYIIHDQHNQIQKYKKQEVVTDSLREELFNANAELGRYELTEEHLKEVNPEAEKEFEEFKDQETE
jgi:hypothetical protein